MTRALAWAAAWLTPSAALAWILWASGQNPASAVAYGWTGIAGAAAYVIVNGLAERRRRRAFDEDAAADFLALGPHGLERIPASETAGRARLYPHLGLSRMHEDIARDAERHRDE